MSETDHEVRTCNGCLMLQVVTEREDARAAWRAVSDQLSAVAAVVEKAQALDARGPGQFKIHQEHLPPAFREVDWQAAFKAVAALLSEVEDALGSAAPASRDAQ